MTNAMSFQQHFHGIVFFGKIKSSRRLHSLCSENASFGCLVLAKTPQARFVALISPSQKAS
jgi:hypothetical protein